MVQITRKILPTSHNPWTKTTRYHLRTRKTIKPVHQAQTISYLKFTNADLAIIVNFGTTFLQDQRLPNFIKNENVEFQWQPQPLAKNILYQYRTFNN
ncbi:MAG: hypothetical protein KAH84_11530 [Thiomargarita sp.]|nr:hypothetical protein [Thiomargarita sp.]